MTYNDTESLRRMAVGVRIAPVGSLSTKRAVKTSNYGRPWVITDSTPWASTSPNFPTYHTSEEVLQALGGAVVLVGGSTSQRDRRVVTSKHGTMRGQAVPDDRNSGTRLVFLPDGVNDPIVLDTTIWEVAFEAPTPSTPIHVSTAEAMQAINGEALSDWFNVPAHHTYTQRAYTHTHWAMGGVEVRTSDAPTREESLTRQARLAQQQRDEARDARDKARAEVKSLKVGAAARSTLLAETNRQLRAARADYAALYERTKRLRETLTEARKQADAQVDTARTTAIAQRAALERSRVEVKNLKEALKEERTRVDLGRALATGLRDDVKRLKSQVEELHALVEHKNARLDSKNARIDALVKQRAERSFDRIAQQPAWSEYDRLVREREEALTREKRATEALADSARINGMVREQRDKAQQELADHKANRWVPPTGLSEHLRDRARAWDPAHWVSTAHRDTLLNAATVLEAIERKSGVDKA